MYWCVSARMHESAHLVHLFIQVLRLFTDGKKLQLENASLCRINLLWVKQIFVHLVFFFQREFFMKSCENEHCQSAESH